MIKNTHKRIMKIFLALTLVLIMSVACSSKDIGELDDKETPVVEVEVEDNEDDKEDEVVVEDEPADVVVEETPSTQELNEAIVTFIDVGQGDGQLIEANGLVVLIDAGTPGNAKKIIQLLDSKGITKIDYIVGTHPHNDHIGGLPPIIDKYEVDNIVIPQVGDKHVPTTKIYAKFLESIENKPNINVIQPEYNKSLYTSTDGHTELTLLSNEDAGLSTGNLNNYSVTLMFKHGDTKFLFTGDAEQEQEAHILNNVSKDDLKANVFSAGHHGSSTSNTKNFLDAVRPEIVVISAKEGNKYNHPNQEALDVFNNVGAETLQTMISGDIVIGSNGIKVYKK